MNGLLPDLESWIKVAGATVAVLMAILVPIRSWIVEDRRYRVQALEALSSSARTPIGHLGATSQVLADSLAMGALAEALQELTVVLRTLVDAGEGREKDRLARALEALL